MSTHTHGFRFKKGNVTKKALSAICLLLSREWGIDVIPEPITEGGLQILVPNGYKSIRFQFINNWPFIKGGEREDWINNNEEFIWQNNKIRGTFLKGFRGAIWSLQEVKDVVKAFELNGIEVFPSTIPNKQKLIGNGHLFF
jgi:hypothetical protein